MTEIFHIELTHYLVLAVLLFGLGIYNIVNRKNAVAVLMGIELVLNSANINLIAFSRFLPMGWNGHVFAVFVIVLAAAEAAIALAIVLQMYRSFEEIEVDQTSNLKG